MTAPVNEELITLINEIKNSKLDKNQSVMLLGDLLSNVINNNVGSNQHWGLGMTLNAYTKKVKGGNREAVGFFGNWAKTHEEAKAQKVPLDPYDVDDVGC